jgi:hypothetical protein
MNEFNMTALNTVPQSSQVDSLRRVRNDPVVTEVLCMHLMGTEQYTVPQSSLMDALRPT